MHVIGEARVKANMRVDDERDCEDTVEDCL